MKFGHTPHDVLHDCNGMSTSKHYAAQTMLRSM